MTKQDMNLLIDSLKEISRLFMPSYAYPEKEECLVFTLKQIEIVGDILIRAADKDKKMTTEEILAPYEKIKLPDIIVHQHDGPADTIVYKDTVTCATEKAKG